MLTVSIGVPVARIVFGVLVSRLPMLMPIDFLLVLQLKLVLRSVHVLSYFMLAYKPFRFSDWVVGPSGLPSGCTHNSKFRYQPKQQ